MANPAVTDESDLLILPEEEGSDITFDEAPIVEENNSEDAELITFDETPEVSEEQAEESTEAPLEIQEDSSDLFDLWSVEQENQPEEQAEETPKQDSSIDLTDSLDLGSQDSDLTIDSTDTQEVFSLEDATNSYISQLEKRKDQISDNITKDEDEIAARKDQISSLNNEITDFNNNIKELKSENTEIDKKIGLVSGKAKTTKK